MASAVKTNLLNKALQVRVSGKRGEVHSAGLAGHALQQIRLAAPCAPWAQVLGVGVGGPQLAAI